MVLIAPSLLSADFSNLRADIEFINQSNADWFHLDIMDGVFVPNISFGLPVVKAVKKYATKPLDVHLMITNPDAYISQFRDAGADWLTVHYEACTHLHRTVQSIHQAGIKAGVSINP
ncbi:MAG TPA: ribulose-phosphate 3-epimerase, partial [Bacteroidales bacterium]|nr:ribulose-phosphate 3-epimerase [Bacteroidales bacterium]